MKNKLQILILSTLVSIVLIPAISFAAITCTSCQVGLCACQITECQRGVFNAYKTADCSGAPLLRGTFSNNVKTWYPPEGISYYALILCDDGSTKSACTQIPVGGILISTTTTTTSLTTTTTEIEATETRTRTTTTTATEETETPSGEGGNSFIWIVVIIVLIVVVAFFFMKRQKAPKSSYETLYKKWSR